MARLIHVYGNATLVPETRAGWPEHLGLILMERDVRLSAPVVNMGDRSLDTFADVVRALGRDRRPLGAVTAVLALAYTDGRSDRLAPSEAALFASLGVEHLLARGAERVLVVGPTAGHTLPSKRAAVGYGGYTRWLRRTEKAVRESLGGSASFVALSGLTVDLTRDGVRPTPAGWKWVASTVADALTGVAR